MPGNRTAGQVPSFRVNVKLTPRGKQTRSPSPHPTAQAERMSHLAYEGSSKPSKSHLPTGGSTGARSQLPPHPACPRSVLHMCVHMCTHSHTHTCCTSSETQILEAGGKRDGEGQLSSSQNLLILPKALGPGPAESAHEGGDGWGSESTGPEQAKPGTSPAGTGPLGASASFPGR